MKKSWEKVKTRLIVWNDWRKMNNNTKLFQLMVLFGLAESGTFNFQYALKDISLNFNNFLKGE